MLNQFRHYVKKGATWGLYGAIGFSGMVLVTQYQRQSHMPGPVTTFFLRQYLRLLALQRDSAPKSPATVEEKEKKPTKRV